MMILDIGKSERGWEVTYDGIFGAEEDTPFFATEAEARSRCEQEAAEWRAWNNSGLADAPHLDNY